MSSSDSPLLCNPPVTWSLISATLSLAIIKERGRGDDDISIGFIVVVEINIERNSLWPNQTIKHLLKVPAPRSEGSQIRCSAVLLKSNLASANIKAAAAIKLCPRRDKTKKREKRLWHAMAGEGASNSSRANPISRLINFDKDYHQIFGRMQILCDYSPSHSPSLFLSNFL